MLLIALILLSLFFVGAGGLLLIHKVLHEGYPEWLAGVLSAAWLVLLWVVFSWAVVMGRG